MVIWHLKQSGKVKKLNKWVPRELTINQKKKKNHFEVSSSLILCNNEPIFDWTEMCDKKWILHTNWQWLAQWLDPEEA